ncbi:AGAP001429-PA-like protein [Anopheles sinensis]|uniref:TRAF3-interacting protein 1 n=1 Tax=Anopheles sinensis TaxID=74873 RepID=A0A084VW37_ANOSI|nr:AGAP001429-PA-like protein [Anopheles sinensis]
MASELDPAVAKRTQSSLGKFVKRPALTEKLLRKPPFRFLHDIVHAIIREHGLLEGLYTADELNSDNIKDRDSKMAFLQKLIDVVKLITGQELKVRPSKVVAGLEPERTNELLQALGFVLEQKLSSTDAVRQYLANSSKVQPNGAVPAGPEPNATNGHAATNVSSESRKEKPKEKTKEKENAGAPVEKKKDRAAKSKEGGKNGAPNTVPVDGRAEKGKGKQNGTKSSPSTSTTESRKKGDKSSKGKEKEKPLKRIPSIPEEQQQTMGKGTSTNAPVNGSDAQVTNGKPTEGRKRKDSLKETVGESPPRSLVVEGQVADDETPLTADEDLDKRNKHSGSNSSSRRSSLKKQNSLTASENNALSEMNQFNGLERSPGPSRQDSGTAGDPGAHEGGEAPEHTGTTSITVTAAAEPKAPGKPPINRQQSVVIDTVMRPRTSLRPPSVRPPSARPGAPRRKEKNVEVILQPNETQKLGDINVKMEVFNNELLDDDGENLIVIEDPTASADVYGGVVIGTVDPSLMGDDGASPLASNEPEEQQGHLVQQILETQKEFSSHTGTEGEMLRKADMEWTTGQRQSSAKQMESLRDSIQKLTRSVNPLGKLMDFIQEDIDSMERELASWQQIYSQSIVELNKERSATESAIEPLKHQLSQIEVNIKEYRESIDSTRANILQNEQKIERLYMTEI